MPGYRDLIVGGSLGGLSFRVRGKDHELGRKTTQSEYPNSDSHSTGDSGKAARSWSFDAFIIGDDYLEQREAWIELLQLPGPHVLVDPWGGKEAIVILKPPGRVRMKETVKEGRMCTFSLDLVEAGDDEVLPSFRDPAASVPGAAALVLASLANNFDDKFKGGGLLQAAANAVYAMSSKLRQFRGNIAAKLNRVENLSSAINEFDDNFEALLLSPLAFAGTFAALWGSVLGLFKGPPFSIANEPAGSRVAAARGSVQGMFVSPDELPSVPGETPKRQQQRANQEEIARIVRVASLTEAVGVFTTISFATGESAAEVQQEMSEYFDAVLDDPVIGDELYGSLVELRALLQQHLETLAFSLPSLSEVTYGTVQVALVMSYRLYGDVGHADEIVNLNHLANPAKVPAGVPLKVVVNDG